MTENDDGEMTIGALQSQIEELRRQIVPATGKTIGPTGRLRRMVGGRTLIAGLVSVAAVLAVGGAAFASIPDAGGVIHGCYSPTGGVLVLSTSPTGSCKSGLTPISWSHTGPQGLQGPQGVQGIHGIAGTNGTNGIDGTNGTNGIDGTNGVDGAPGAPGALGAAGSNGVSGYQIVNAETTGLNAGDSATVACPTGKHALGGGGEITADINGGAFIDGGEPTIGGVGWKVFTNASFTYSQDEIRDQAGANELFGKANGISVSVYAVCATTAP